LIVFFGVKLPFYVSGLLSPLFGNIPVLGYALKRINETDTAWQTETLGFLSLGLLIFNYAVTYYSIGFRNIEEVIVVPILRVNTFLMAFIFSLYNYTEIALRFSLLSFFLFPLSLYLLCDRLSKKIVLVFLPFLVISMFAWVGYKLSYGQFHYVGLSRLLMPVNYIIYE